MSSSPSMCHWCLGCLTSPRTKVRRRFSSQARSATSTPVAASSLTSRQTVQNKNLHSTDTIATENSGTRGRPIWVHSSQVGKADSKWVFAAAAGPASGAEPDLTLATPRSQGVTPVAASDRSGAQPSAPAARRYHDAAVRPACPPASADRTPADKAPATPAAGPIAPDRGSREAP